MKPVPMMVMSMAFPYVALKDNALIAVWVAR